MDFVPKTADILAAGEYFGSPQSFLAGFGVAYDSVRGQIVKFEGRQEYHELGNISYEAFLRGEFDRAVELIRDSKEEDRAIYARLAENKIEMTRVRPVKIPFSSYLEWEFENYKVSEEFGERIFVFHYDHLAELLESNVQHDFMVFDARFAYIHNYSDSGELIGGWRIQDIEGIYKLLSLFALMKANSYHYRLCK